MHVGTDVYLPPRQILAKSTHEYTLPKIPMPVYELIDNMRIINLHLIVRGKNMRKLLLIFSLVLTGCMSEVVNSIQRERNPRCENVQELEVFQVFSDGALAFTCERKSYDDCAWGITVAVPKDLNDILYDKQRIKAPKDKCIVFNNTYQYKNKDNDTKTVPVVGFEYEYSAASAAEIEERLADAKSEIYNSCLEEMNKEFNKTPEENKNKCLCVSDTMMEQLISLMVQDDTVQIDGTGTKILEHIETECGKLPKSMKE